jgi:cysteine desulfurase
MDPSARSYLDYNASAPMRPEVVEAVLRASALCGNPSSVHAEGRQARAAIETARAAVAALVGADARDVVFTSGGTEAVNTVLSPGLRRGTLRAASLLIAATEHPCGLDGHGFPPEAVTILPVSGDGLLRLDVLDQAMAQAGPALVSVHAANNETGAVQPLGEVSARVHGAGGLVHSDAVQAAGRVPLDMAALKLDAVTLSAHKLGGPKGVGALVLGSGVDLAEGRMRGGGQERGRRAGTPNVAGIVGFGVAAEIARREREAEARRLGNLRDWFEGVIRRLAPAACIFAGDVERLPNTLAFAVPGLRAETALIALDLAGVAVSSGSACSSGKVRRSHVLEAMGISPDLAEGAIRISLGWNSSEADLSRFARAFETLIGTLYVRRRASAA